MKKIALLPALYLTFQVNVILTAFFGETSVLALEGLWKRRAELEANLDNLESTHEELKRRFEALRNDPEAILVEARGLGLYRPDDSVLRLGGDDEWHRPFDTGRVLRMETSSKFDRSHFRFVSVVFGLTVILMTLIINWERRDTQT